jgi:hypothetical protein
MNRARHLEAAWRAFWFQPEPPQALEACRILLYAGLLFVFLNRDFTICSVLGEIYWRPTSFAHLIFPYGPPPVMLVAWMQMVWKISLFTSCLGLATRFSTAVAGIFGLVLLELPNNLGKLDHQMAAAGVALLVMGFSSCGRTWSMDAWIAQLRGKPLPPLSGEETGWPIRTMRVVISLVFFCAACNKLRASGLAWVFSDTLQMYLLLRRMGGVVTWMVRHPWLCRAMAGFALTVEFFHPLSLISKRFARLWIPLGIGMFIGMFIGIYFTLGINFFFLVFLHFFWLPWGRIFRPVAAQAGLSVKKRLPSQPIAS